MNWKFENELLELSYNTTCISRSFTLKLTKLHIQTPDDMTVDVLTKNEKRQKETINVKTISNA